jgi:hypothetical protein
MLKRNGEPVQYSVPGFSGKLNRGEFDAYNEAFDQIKAEFAALQRVRSLLDDLNKDPVVFTIPDKRDGETIDARDAELGEIRWMNMRNGCGFRSDTRQRCWRCWAAIKFPIAHWKFQI